MKCAVAILAYNRPEMLKQVLTSVNGKADYIAVFDDGSPYELKGDNVFQNEVNKGKEHFWEQFDKAFKWAKDTDADTFIFMPDDFVELRFEDIMAMADTFHHDYAYNLINDGRMRCWGGKDAIPINSSTIEVDFCDGGFFCGRSTLESIDWAMPMVQAGWFNRPDKSSGIGWMLTNLFRVKGIKMYIPTKSYAYHGDHESMMHPKERKKNKLISR